MTVALGDGDGETWACSQLQSLSLIQLGLTQRLSLVFGMVIQRRLDSQSLSLSHLSKQAFLIPGQAQSVSLVQLGLTQRLSPPTVIQSKSVSHSALLSQVSKQAVRPVKLNVFSQEAVCGVVEVSVTVSLIVHSWDLVKLSGAVQFVGLVVVEDRVPLLVLLVVTVQACVYVPEPPVN